MPQATLRIRSNDPQSPADLPLTSLIGNQAQVAECEDGFTGDDVTVAEGIHTAHILAQANAAALAVAEAGLECEPVDFDEIPPLTAGNMSEIAELSNGDLMIGGSNFGVAPLGIPNRIMRLNRLSGALFPGFVTTVENSVDAVFVAPDDTVYIGGTFANVLGIARTRGAAINPDGTLKTSFVNPVLDNAVNDIIVQSTGKVIFVGAFTNAGGAAHTRIARFNTDGTVDAAFTASSSGGVDEAPHHLVLLAADQFLIARSFGTINGVTRRGLARMNSDGSLDTSFPDVNTSGVVAAILLVSGKYLINPNTGIWGGVFLDGGNAKIVRVNTDGTRDTSFTHTGGITADAMAEQADGKIIVVGGNGIGAAGFIRRLNANGSSDTFGGSTDSQIFDVFIQNIGGTEYIVCVGAFNNANGQPANRICRFDLDGNLA